jgi:hypothetical protein
MMARIEQEAQLVGGTLLPEVEVVVKNIATELEYDSDDAAAADVADPNTATTDSDISRSVTLRVVKGVESEGQA